MKHLFACAAVGFGAAVASVATPASAVVITVTSGGNPGVVFNSGGFDAQSTGALVTPSAGTWTSVNAGTGANSPAPAVVTGPTVGGPSSANSGANYLDVTRGSTGTTYTAADFTRSINLASESFTLEYAHWGVTNAFAFAIGTSTIDSAVTGEPGVLAGWRYVGGATPGFQQFKGTGQAALTDEFLSLPYLIGDWNIVTFTWNAGTASAGDEVGSFTMNGQTVGLIPRVTNPPPATVSRFFISPGALSTAIHLDAVPEPASLGALGIAAAAALLRRRRRASGV